MTERTISKVLVTQEDLALGQGATSQTRQGISTSVTKIDLPWVVTTLIEVQRLDTTKYKHCLLDNGTEVKLYYYDASSSETVDNYFYIAPNTGDGQWVYKDFGQDRKPLASYTALRALTSAQIKDGEYLYVLGQVEPFEVKTGTVTDNDGILLVFDDDSNRYVERVYDGAIIPSWFRAAGDGVTDDTAAMVNFFSAIEDYTVADLAGKRYLVDPGSLSISNADKFKILGRGAVFIESAQNEENFITITSCDSFRIKEIFFDGLEDTTYWEANDQTSSGRAAFIKLDSCNKGKIKDIDANNKRLTVWLQDCHRCSVSEVIYEGFLPDYDSQSVTAVNFLSCIFVNNGSRNKVYNVDCDDHGSAVLIGTDAISTLTYNITGDNIHDNVVYVSSGSKSITYAVNAEHVNSQCVKTRGNQNITFGCVTKDCSADPYSMTGNGTTLDSDGANGHSNILALCVGTDTGNGGGGGGVQTTSQDGYFMRDSIVALNVINDVNSTGDDAPIRGIQIKGGIYLANIVSDFDTEQAITIASGGGGAAENDHCIVALNQIGSNSAANQGIAIIDGRSMLAIGNVTRDDLRVIEAKDPQKCLFIGNSNPGGRAVEYFSGDEGSENFMIGNRGTTGGGSDQASADNYPVSSTYSTSDTPLYVGQMTISGGEFFIATGVSSSADWAQITNP